MIKAVIFDLDGVIVHTDKYHYFAWKALADKINVYFDESINDRCRGVSRMASLDIILERSSRAYSDQEKAIFAQFKNEIYRQKLSEMTKAEVSDEVRDTLLAIKAKKIKIAIGSSSKNAKLILQRTGLTELFDAISDGENLIHSKPDPEVFLKASQYLQISPEDCMIVEDAAAGVEAGKRAGMTMVAYGKNAASLQADYTVRDFSQLLRLL